MSKRSVPHLSIVGSDGGPQESARPDVSAVICAYTEDRWDDLLAAIQSVQDQQLPPRELIVVIDHNPILLRRVRAAVSGVTVVANRGQRGLSGARNTGIDVASGAVIAFLDDDAVADPDWLARLMNGYQVDGRDDHRILGVGGSISPIWANRRPSWFPEEFDWVVGCTYRGMAPTTTPVRNLIGCNMSFRRDVLVGLGGFRSEVGRVGSQLSSCEETELCIRARQRFPGAVFLHEPRARVAHRVPVGRTRWRYFRSRCFAEGRSKAIVARLVGADEGLSSERTYTLRTLPSGAIRGLMDVVAHRDVGGALRAAAIAAGLSITTFGYVTAAMSTRAPLRSRSRVSVAPAADSDQFVPSAGRAGSGR